MFEFTAVSSPIAPSPSTPEPTPCSSSSNGCFLTNLRSSAHEILIPPAPSKTWSSGGAGAIGATAAYGLAQGARAFRGTSLTRFEQHLTTVYQTLKNARPTAVDPVNAMNQVLAELKLIGNSEARRFRSVKEALALLPALAGPVEVLHDLQEDTMEYIVPLGFEPVRKRPLSARGGKPPGK